MESPRHESAPVSPSGDCALYDTRDANWSTSPPLRANFNCHHREIKSAADLKATLRAGGYAWPGGYPLYFVTSDGAALSFESVRANLRDCLGAIDFPDRFEAEWRVVACDINWEDSELRCDHSGERIPAAYDDDSESESGQ